MKKIPLLSVQKSNEISDYVPFRHTKTYIRSKSILFPSNHNLMVSIAYRIIHNFKAHRSEWDLLTRRVPIKYFSAIGVDLDVLRFTLELDQQEFDQFLELPFYPKSGGIRLMSTEYRTIEFPPKTTEGKAIQILQEYSKGTGMYCFITQANIKTIWVQPDGALSTTFYRPEIEIVKAWVKASGTGR
jgi:hypothetical protein